MEQLFLSLKKSSFLLKNFHFPKRKMVHVKVFRKRYDGWSSQ